MYIATRRIPCPRSVARKQFLLVTSWALTHWKAQGMTLRRARISLGKRAAGISGIGYVAITRVKHPRHLVFEADLPAWECFQEARHTNPFDHGGVLISGTHPSVRKLFGGMDSVKRTCGRGWMPREQTGC